MRVCTSAFAAGIVAASGVGVVSAQPSYDIFNIGVVDPGDIGSQGLGVSPGGIAVGRSQGVSNQAFSWTEAGGLAPLPKLADRAFNVANGANNSGVVVGTASATFFGSNPLPVMWVNRAIIQLDLPGSFTVGRANDVNSAGVTVGSVGGGIQETAVLWDASGSPVLVNTPTPGGATMRTAFRINDSGWIVGQGTDPDNAARNVGMVFDSFTGDSFEVGALPGDNGALAFGVSNAGHVVGSSMLNQGSGRPFVWTQAGGMVEIPLPAGTSSGIARAVNSDGWVVGIASGQFAVPFLFDGTTTYALGDLIDPASGWDLLTNTSSGALGIAEDGSIVGTGVFDGDIRAFAMIVPAPGTFALLVLGGLASARRRR
ncbi:MAG: hypothetical protein EA423_04810 [Phycisphaerales bacterium]|nr:MAG: hypothetical protein EA423_04810 [Phycisphaerales bacterium]